MEGHAALQEAAPGAVPHRAEQMFRLYANDVHRYIARRIGTDQARDLTSETFRVAVERIDTYVAERGHERAWLFGIATNLLRNHRRAEQRRLAALARDSNRRPLDQPDPLVGVDRRIDAASVASEVFRQVAALDATDRDLLVLYAWENCSYAQIATALDLPIGTVRSRLHRIRRSINFPESEQ